MFIRRGVRSKKRAPVVVTSLVILGTLWLGTPPPAAAGPAMSRYGSTLDLTESQCVRKARRSVSNLRETDRTISSEVDDDTVWLSNDSFTGMIMCIRLRDEKTLSLIIVTSDSGDLARAVKDSLKRGMR